MGRLATSEALRDGGILRGGPALRCATNAGWGMRATHPPPPPSPHQSTNLPASKRALKALQRILTTPNGQDARLGSPAGASLPPVPAGRSHHSGVIRRHAQ